MIKREHKTATVGSLDTKVYLQLLFNSNHRRERDRVLEMRQLIKIDRENKLLEVKVTVTDLVISSLLTQPPPPWGPPLSSVGSLLLLFFFWLPPLPRIFFLYMFLQPFLDKCFYHMSPLKLWMTCLRKTGLIRLDLYKSKSSQLWTASLARKQFITKIINQNP